MCIFCIGNLLSLISPITEKDWRAILELDRRVSGEDREGLLPSVCIPEANAAAAGLLAVLGYEAYLTATRMFLHRNVQWDPQKVYARGSGALG